MYFHPGIYRHEIGDFEVVEKDGQLHVFCLELPSHDSIGHLVSDDGGGVFSNISIQKLQRPKTNWELE